MARRRRPPRAGALSDLAPLKIAAQIATLQALFYIAALVLMLFTALVVGTGFDLDLVLGWDRIRGDTSQGWMLSLIWLLVGGFCLAVAMVALIGRSKLVPDFALTTHFIHLVVTTLWSHSLPLNAMWWAAMAASSGLAVALGMWGCQYRELQPVFFGGGRILGSNGAPPAAATQQRHDDDDDDDDENHPLNGGPPEGDEEMGLGRGRGSRRGGPGEYEMNKLESSR